MDNNYNNLTRLFDQLKNIGFWGRVFKWNSVKNLVIDAAADMQRLQMNNEGLTQIQNDLKSRLSIADATVNGKQNRMHEMDIELMNYKNDLKNSQEELSIANNSVAQFLASKENKEQEHSTHLTTLKEFQDHIQSLRKKEVEDKQQIEMNRILNLKLTWSNHEQEVKQVMKSICAKHTIQYIDKVPFKGEPDNTLLIAGEYIVFDAKSPGGEDLNNFPGYIRDQSEKAVKYARQENVKKWIFFVVPSNTLEVLKTFAYHLADYEVFVITIDALEPIILSLRKIEEYDFADQMNPEDRENICRVLGRFAHLSKRRIQIDTYFINQFMELAYKSESDLPPDILEKVKDFERADKLNPPQEKRAKAISLADLEKSTQKLRNDAASKGILIEDSKISLGLNGLPLYTPLTHNA